MKLQSRVTAMVKASLRALPMIFLLLLALAAWRFVFSPFTTEKGRLTFSSPLPTISPLPTGTARISPTPVERVTPNATQTSGADLVATKEAGLAFARQTAEAARLVTPDPTQLFQKLHPTTVVWPTPDLAIPQRVFGGTPAGSGAITKMIPPFYTREYGVENSWREVTENETSVIYVHAGFVPTAAGTATQQGLVVVQMLRKNPTTGNYDMASLTQFPTLTQTGPVHIADAVGERLILQSTRGSIYYFDVPTRQYVSSLIVTVTVPPPAENPVTPVPSVTPAP